MKSKKVQAIIGVIISLLIITMVSAIAFADTKDYTITASSDVSEAKPGELITVKVNVTGGEFVGAQVSLSYDAEKLEYVSSAAGWGNDGDGILSFLNVCPADCWQDGKTLGTFKFIALENVSGDTAFNFDKADAYIASSWSDGFSSEAPTPLSPSQLKGCSVSITGNAGAAGTPTSEYGTLYDDGETVIMETGKKIYEALDEDETNGKEITWSSSDETVAAVDQDGLVTAKGEGKVTLTAKDEAGNVVAEKLLIVGNEADIPGNGQEENTPEAEPVQKTTNSGLWITVIVLAAVVVGIVFIIKKKKK